MPPGWGIQVARRSREGRHDPSFVAFPLSATTGRLVEAGRRRCPIPYDRARLSRCSAVTSQWPRVVLGLSQTTDRRYRRLRRYIARASRPDCTEPEPLRRYGGEDGTS